MLSRNLPVLRQLLALVLLFTFTSLAAQENCANGIDDDGDGLVDLNDREDCSCGLPSAIPSLLPNPSLEEFAADEPGCSSQQPNGLPDGTNQANCLVGWERISLGTTDAWNAFTLPGSAPTFPVELPQPLPSGSSVAGFWVGIKDTKGVQFVNGDGSAVRGYREYLATCLEEGRTIKRGEDYRLTFSLGFMEPQTMELSYTDGIVSLRSPPTIELSIYGVKRCDQLNFGSFYGCPEDSGAEGYELIGNLMVSGTPGQWSAASLDFVSAGDYTAFAIGGSCAEDIKLADGGLYRNYYFIDDLILNKQEAFEQAVAGPVAVAGQSMCADEIVLSGQPVAGATYQWYRNGVAIDAATAYLLPLAVGGDIDGLYALRIATPRGCAVTEPVRIQRPVIPDQFPDSLALCAPDQAITLYPAGGIPSTYAWGDGSTASSFTVQNPGTYSVTITSACVERVEQIVATYADSTPYRYVLNPAAPCVGDTVEISLQTNYYAPLTIYMLPNGAQYFVEGKEPIRVVAGETSEVRAILLTSCGMKSDVIPVPGLMPHQVTAAVTDLNCHGPEGSIVLSHVEGDTATARYAWTGPDGKPLTAAAPAITPRSPGQYRVEVSGGTRCAASYSYEITDNDNFSLLVNATDVACGNDATAFALATGGTPPYAVTWLKEVDAPPVAPRGSVASGLDRGTFIAEVSDQRGCSTATTFTVHGPDPLRIEKAETEVIGCHEAAAGSLHVTASGGTFPYLYRLADGEAAQATRSLTGLGEGLHTVVATDDLGCDSPPFAVEIDLPDVFELDAGKDRRISLGESTTLDFHLAGIDPEQGKISLTPGYGLNTTYDPFFGFSVECTPTRTTEYFVTFTSLDHCSRTDSITVVVDPTAHVYAPTAFSPNQDGHNDLFTLYGNPVVKEVLDLQVFDRWGGLVWQKPAGAPGEWDGTRFGEPLGTGTYVYRGSLLLRDGTTSEVRGSVLLTQ